MNGSSLFKSRSHGSPHPFLKRIRSVDWKKSLSEGRKTIVSLYYHNSILQRERFCWNKHFCCILLMKRVLVTTVPDQEHTFGQSVSLRHDKHEFFFLMSMVPLQFLSNKAIYSAQEGVVVMKFCHTAPKGTPFGCHHSILATAKESWLQSPKFSN